MPEWSAVHGAARFSRAAISPYTAGRMGDCLDSPVRAARGRGRHARDGGCNSKNPAKFTNHCASRIASNGRTRCALDSKSEIRSRDWRRCHVSWLQPQESLFIEFPFESLGRDRALRLGNVTEFTKTAG